MWGISKKKKKKKKINKEIRKSEIRKSEIHPKSEIRKSNRSNGIQNVLVFVIAMGKTVEYRICMPLSVAEYKIGQLYMIARHSFENTSKNEGIEVLTNEPFQDSIYGAG